MAGASTTALITTTWEFVAIRDAALKMRELCDEERGGRGGGGGGLQDHRQQREWREEGVFTCLQQNVQFFVDSWCVCVCGLSKRG
mmetsp:Transcript_29733/g.67245  ORF Transcript_29733/g.67245 Transcript_29733/m.67245 type:complete len:85 (-) Transcript_29733:74-328(-)